jgi:hypothetical protein
VEISFLLRRALLKRASFLCALWIAAVCPAAAAARPHYDVDYQVEFLPREGVAAVTITLEPHSGRASRLRLRMAPKRYVGVSGDGRVARAGDLVTWEPPAAGGALRYRYKIDHQRRGGGFDARITADWVIVRGDDLVPPASVRATRGADSRARLRFVLPKGWHVNTPHTPTLDRSAFVVVDPRRRFDRPAGWIIAGAIGTRREWIGDTRLSVSGPASHDVRRNDIIAFANLALPQMKRAFGELPPKLLVVSAGDPMWRGGLSGPRSLFLHTGRPLISENGTSSLVHELTHVVTRIRGAPGDDWIAEGLAEYYAIELPRRAGLLTAIRRDQALDWMRRFGQGVERLRARRSSGRVTARAVTLLHDLDREIAARSDGEKNLDDVVRALIPIRVVSRDDLRRVAEQLLGAPSQVLASPLLAERQSVIRTVRLPNTGVSSSIACLNDGRPCRRSRNARSRGQRRRSGATPAWHRFTNGLATAMSAIESRSPTKNSRSPSSRSR